MIPNPSDPDTWMCLCSAGLPGWSAVEVITPTGDRHLLLNNPDAPDDRYRTTELTPPTRNPARCRPWCTDGWPPSNHAAAAETTAGTPCRIPVARFGDGCSWHRTAGGTTESPKR